VSSSSELARVAALRARFASDANALRGVRVGIGDDAAVLDAMAAAGSIVWTIDAQVEGTHFKSEWVSWEDVGWRSFMAAASDLAAMGAEPVAALSALVLTGAIDDEALDAIARGQAGAADDVGAPVVGGNLARGSETSITTTLIGRSAAPVLRSGARAGDGLWLAGPAGLAGVGLALLEANMEAHMQDARIRACVQAWRRPKARIAEGRGLAGVAHAAIDLSDGLAHDAAQLAEASQVRLILDLDAIEEAAGDALVHGAAALGRPSADFALYGGEDYALLAASDTALPGFVQIGSVEAYDDTNDGARVLVRTPRGTTPVDPRGFDHFTRA
jgi:thiamine-monophosphate kinase